jgi:hypothetical protein
VTNLLNERIERIKTDIGIDDPARAALVARITVRAAGLQARGLSGEDVAAELAHVAAQAANLDEHARHTVGKHLLGLATDILSKALGVALVV